MLILLILLFCIPIPITLQGKIKVEGQADFDKLIEDGKNFEEKWVSYTRDGREIPNDFEWHNLTINGFEFQGSMKVYIPYYMIIAGMQL